MILILILIIFLILTLLLPIIVTQKMSKLYYSNSAYSQNNLKLTTKLNINLKNSHIPENYVKDTYTECCNYYKKEYLNNRDFSLDSEDITEELDEIINEFDINLKRRNEILSDSIYSDILDEFEISPYNPEPQEKPKSLITHNFEQEIKSKKFSDIQKKNRNLEIKLDTDEDKESPLNKKDTIQYDKKSTIDLDFNEKRELSHINTEDYNLSNSNIRVEVTEKSGIYKASEIMLSQPNIFQDSQISRNPFSMSNIFSRNENEDFIVYNSKLGTNNESRSLSGSNNDKKMSINQSIDMSFLNKASQLGNFIPLDLPDLDLLHNSTRLANEFDMANEKFDNYDKKMTIDHSQGKLSITRDMNRNSILESHRQLSYVPSDISHYSPKFLSNINLSSSITDGEIRKILMLEKLFDKIHNQNLFNIKTYSFPQTKLKYLDLKIDDPFLEEFVNLLDKENFFNEELFDRVKEKFSIRFEIYFFDICKKFLDLKKKIFLNPDSKEILEIKRKMLKYIKELHDCLANNDFLVKDDDVYIFKPVQLLKFWDTATEDLDINTFQELLKLFAIKTILKKNRHMKNLISAFNEIKIVFNEPNIYDKSQIFLYYFGKLLTIFIERRHELNDEDIFKLIDKKKSENYNKIKKVLEGFGYPQSNNFKKLANNFNNLAKISEYFGEDPKATEIYVKKAKRYHEFYNNPNKLHLTRESTNSMVNLRESSSSLI